MHTRKDFLNKDCTFEEYYDQFVDGAVVNWVQQAIGKDKIIASTDEHLNDIPRALWDLILSPVPSHIDKKMREAGDYPTLAGIVCICKQAARRIK